MCLHASCAEPPSAWPRGVEIGQSGVDFGTHQPRGEQPPRRSARGVTDRSGRSRHVGREDDVMVVPMRSRHGFAVSRHRRMIGRAALPPFRSNRHRLGTGRSGRSHCHRRRAGSTRPALGAKSCMIGCTNWYDRLDIILEQHLQFHGTDWDRLSAEWSIASIVARHIGSSWRVSVRALCLHVELTK